MQEIATTRFSEEFLGLCGMGIGLTALIGGMVVAVVGIMAAHYRRTRRDEMDATLKIEMIERGMSAGDIERVLNARSPEPEYSAYYRQFNRGSRTRSPVA